MLRTRRVCSDVYALSELQCRGATQRSNRAQDQDWPVLAGEPLGPLHFVSVARSVWCRDDTASFGYHEPGRRVDDILSASNVDDASGSRASRTAPRSPVPRPSNAVLVLVLVLVVVVVVVLLLLLLLVRE